MDVEVGEKKCKLISVMLLSISFIYGNFMFILIEYTKNGLQ